MSSPKFGPGDKIFAKVRGYPHWPARVEGVADETPNKMKYHVYFYGTGETAVCKQEELCSYLDNREKYGKPMKKKGFNEALIQIGLELGLSPTVQAPQTPGAEEAEFEGSSIIEDSVDNKPKPTTSTPVTSKIKEQKSSAPKRKPDDFESDISSKKPRKKSLADHDSDISAKRSVPAESPVISRSGRKIKPKKVEELDENGGTPKVKSIRNQKLKASSEGKHLDIDAELINEGILVAYTPKGEQIRIKIETKNKPAVFKGEKARLEWEAKLMEDGHKLKAQIESGKILPEDVQREIDEKYKDKLVQIEQKMSRDDKQEKLDILKIESDMLDIEVKIKNSLSLKQAEPETCLTLIDEFMFLKLSPLMLKKHPEVVDTIKKLRRYVGNTSTWDMSSEELLLFSNKAASIRSKAEHVYNKIKSLFMVPYGKSFWDTFAQELKEFNESIKNMDNEEICALITDPTENSSKAIPEESKTAELVNSSEP